MTRIRDYVISAVQRAHERDGLPAVDPSDLQQLVDEVHRYAALDTGPDQPNRAHFQSMRDLIDKSRAELGWPLPGGG